MPTPPAAPYQAPEYSRTTIRSYEYEAASYNAEISPHPPAAIEAALRRMLDIVEPGGTVLEVGSGPGRDADYIESQAVKVRRTDATQAFISLQAARGKHVETLNLISDDLGGPYDAVLAMCVLIHVDRALTSAVLGKVATALRPGGAFLVSVREGTGERYDHEYHMTYWSRDEFAGLLTDAGLRVAWEERRTDCDDHTWLTFLAKKAAARPEGHGW